MVDHGPFLWETCGPRKAEAVARYGEGAVDQELPLADKLRRDGERSRKAAPVFNTGPVASKSQPAKEERGPGAGGLGGLGGSGQVQAHPVQEGGHAVGGAGEIGTGGAQRAWACELRR